MKPLLPDVTVNGVLIDPTLIANEAQNHPAPQGKPGLAWQAAARALAVRTLLLQEAGTQTEFRIALPQTGEFAHLSVGQTVTFGFDPQRVVCFAAGTTSNAHVFS